MGQPIRDSTTTAEAEGGSSRHPSVGSKTTGWAGIYGMIAAPTTDDPTLLSVTVVDNEPKVPRLTMVLQDPKCQ